ncbi:hypothetical protein G6M50_28685 [Agrobacterium rhizogenes]|uniref:Uncharacterized protein n=2 Tax=unclassified Rhizobium TaxID=2613769 RepID=A0AAU7SBS4_9HYPH|nr:hypothetical protein [Rhizobium rhizogenes]NTJ81770.1 hypothetical protein [Rhizobium rhizogenes]
MRNHPILARLRSQMHAALAGAQYHLSRFGVLLREAATIAFTLRCRVIDRR